MLSINIELKTMCVLFDLPVGIQWVEVHIGYVYGMLYPINNLPIAILTFKV
jgi:hypothetical protein